MTTTVQFTTIATSIAAIDLSANSINSVDITTMPERADFNLPLFTPRPDNFITDITFTRDSFGSNGAEKMTLEYSMHWHYFHCPAGASLGIFSTYGALLDNLAFIIESIMDNDAPTGAIDIQIRDIPNIAIFKDPAGNDVLGAELAIRVKEFVT